MGPLLSTFQLLADELQSETETDAKQTYCTHREDPICDACTLHILETVTYFRRRSAHRKTQDSVRTRIHDKNMECERRSSTDCTHHSHPSRIINYSAHEEYKQTADRILQDFATFEWPAQADDGEESPCPSLVASTESLSRIESFIADLNKLSIKTVQHREETNHSELLKASERSLDPWLMQNLREVQARWSGSYPGYLDEVYRDGSGPQPGYLDEVYGTDTPDPTTSTKAFSDLAKISEPSSLSANALIDALDDAFRPTLQKYARSDSDVSDLDLTDSVPGSASGSAGGASSSTGSWKTAEDCEEVMKRRHSLADAGMLGKRPRAVARWAHSFGFGAMTASI